MRFSCHPLFRVLFIASIGIALVAGISGASHFGMAMTVDMSEHANTSDCFMPGTATFCNTNILTHLATWENTFIALTRQASLLSFLLLISIFIAFSVFQRHVLRILPRDAFQFFLLYTARSNSFFTSLFEKLFSAGILHPKYF